MANIRNITQLLLHLNDDEIILNKENIVEYTGELPKSYNEPSSFTLLGKPFQNACIRAGYKCVEADINNDRYVISKINVATIENVNNNENIVISQNISLNNTNDCSEVIEEEKRTAPQRWAKQPNDQLRQLRGTIRLLAVMVAVLSILLCLTAAALFRTLDYGKTVQAIKEWGRNYTTIIGD